MMAESRGEYGKFFKRVRRIARFFLPKFQINQFTSDLEGPIVFVSHHQNMKGPLSTMIWLPFFVRIWALSFMCDEEECVEHYSTYTFSERFNMPQKLADLMASLAAKIIVPLMKSVRMIPVYRQSRKIIYTIKESIRALEQKHPVLIFPDIDYQRDSEKIGEIYEGFLNLEKYYYKRLKEKISFVPMYSDIENRVIHIGRPLQFPHQDEFATERKVMAEKLQENLNELSKISDESSKTV